MKSFLYYSELFLVILLVCSRINTNKIRIKLPGAEGSTVRFAHELANNLSADPIPIAECIPKDWKSTQVITMNNVFKEGEKYLTLMKQELLAYKNFLTSSVNYECHRSGDAKQGMINEMFAKHKKDDFSGDQKFHASLKDFLLTIRHEEIDVEEKKSTSKPSSAKNNDDKKGGNAKANANTNVMGNSKGGSNSKPHPDVKQNNPNPATNKKPNSFKNGSKSNTTKSLSPKKKEGNNPHKKPQARKPPQPAKPTPKLNAMKIIHSNIVKTTKDKHDSSGGKILLFYQDNFTNFKKNVLTILHSKLFIAIYAMFNCILGKKPDVDFKRNQSNIMKNLAVINQNGIKGDISVGIDILCNWKNLKNVLENLEKGFASDGDKRWNFFTLAITSFLRILTF